MGMEETNSKIYIFLFIILNLFGDVASRKSMLYQNEEDQYPQLKDKTF